MPPGVSSDRPVRVAWVGSEVDATLPDDDRCSVRAGQDDVDCVVVDWATADAPADAVRSATEQAPVVVVDPSADATIAAAATRAGASEYVTPAALGETETIADRIVAVADAARADERDADGHVKDVLQRVEDAFFAVDRDWRFTFVNNRAEVLLERDAEDLVGRRVWDAFPDAIGTTFERKYRTAMERQEVVSFEAAYPPLDTTFEVTAYPSEDGLSVYFRDVGDQHRYRDSLRELLLTTHDLVGADSAADVAEMTATAATEVLGVDHGVVHLLEDGTLEPSAAGEREATADPQPVAPGVGLSGTVFERGELLSAEEIEGLDAERAGPPESRLAVPLGEYGVLTVESADGFDEVDRTLLALLSTLAETAIDAAERKRSLRRYKAVHETVKQMIYVVGPDGRIRLVTDPLLERFGFDRDGVLGEHISNIIDEDVYRAANDAVVELQADPTLESRTIETSLRTTDGESVPVSITLSLLSSASEFEGVVGVIQDRSELAALEDALSDERTRFAHLFDRLPDAVVDTEFVDGEPTVRSVNEAFEDIFGYDEEEIRGESVNDLIVPDEYENRARDIDRSAERESYDIFEVERKTASGRKNFLFRGFLYPTDDDTERGFGIYTDITDRLEQEQRLQVLHRVLRHNLRNQMTTIMGNADLLAERTDGEAAEYADRIRREASEVASLGEQVQRIEQTLDNDRYSATRVDPLDPITDVVEEAREAYPHAEIRISVRDDSAVLADELLELAVSEVVENAIEHNDDAPTVDIEIAPSDDDPDEWLDITVSDDGPGIPEREQEILSGDREITQVDHSMGLGLWVARWITEGVGGRLLFGPCDENGSTVTLRFRRADADQSPA